MQYYEEEYFSEEYNHTMLVFLRTNNYIYILVSMVVQQKPETGNLRCSRQNFTYISIFGIHFLTKAQPFTFYCQFELFKRFYIPKMTFLAQYLLYRLYHNVYIIYHFSPNSFSVRSMFVHYPFFNHFILSKILPICFISLMFPPISIE